MYLYMTNCLDTELKDSSKKTQAKLDIYSLPSTVLDIGDYGADKDAILALSEQTNLYAQMWAL